MRIDSTMPEAKRKLFKVVRTDSFEDIPGEIVTADEQTGACQVKDRTGNTRDYELGGHGALKIVPRK